MKAVPVKPTSTLTTPVKSGNARSTQTTQAPIRLANIKEEADTQRVIDPVKLTYDNGDPLADVEQHDF